MWDCGTDFQIRIMASRDPKVWYDGRQKTARWVSRAGPGPRMEATGTTRLQGRQKCPQIDFKHFEVNFGIGSSVTRCTAWTSILRQAFCFSQLGSKFLHRRLAWHRISHNGTRLDIADTTLGRDVACYERVFSLISGLGAGPAKRPSRFMRNQSNIDESRTDTIDDALGCRC
ncbi:hypothetical protein BDP81DRAFT_415226 [Colletotrichum phormii]|uniref:Uncharacterized protein n=1 Tax=Colletotrichum phormii TaxID=359342 RepID=A0AAJ0A1G4_9PEZI|nr:uncharacterized protein BDP81DRAFT_415226 [Colletotrichum phormii]KAK1654218.1 hypothetical protein BDP81DRAFT_415226 [Colletotrichum phormii]